MLFSEHIPILYQSQIPKCFYQFASEHNMYKSQYFLSISICSKNMQRQSQFFRIQEIHSIVHQKPQTSLVD